MNYGIMPIVKQLLCLHLPIATHTHSSKSVYPRYTNSYRGCFGFH